MKRFRNLCGTLVAAASWSILLTGCVDRPGEGAGPGPVPEAGNGFDYATTNEVRIAVDYAHKGTKAVFELFAENPVTAKEGLLVRKPGVRSLLKTYTDADSRYTGVVDLPTGTEKVYLYSETYGLPACMEVKVGANGISFDLLEAYREAGGRNPRKAASVQADAARANTSDNPYNIRPLGKWTPYGLPLYILGELDPHTQNNIAPYYATTPAGLMNRVQNVLLPGADNSSYARPTGVVNINVKEDAHLTLVFAAEMGAWRNAIGYYYYPKLNPPKTAAEFDALPKYVAFPNCSSFTTNFEDPNDFGAVGSDWTAPLFFGEQLPLKYFKEDGTTTELFPKGTTIGWFLLPDAYDVSSGKLDMTGSKHAIRYSDNEFNEGNARYMVSLYDKPSGKTVLGFEDGGDNDYKDVLFYIEADPQHAIDDPNRPGTEPDDEKYPDIVSDPIEGTLAFEDLWPSQGDYDMNDIVVRYSTTFTTDKENRIVAIEDVFTPLHSGGKLKSAFGYRLDLPAGAMKTAAIENGSSSAYAAGGMETGQSKPTFMLFDDIGAAVAQGPVTVTLTLDGSVRMNEVSRKSLYNPFVCVSDDGFVPGKIRKEVHLTNYAPTDLADPYPFGKFDDKSSVDKAGNPTGPYYYVTLDRYPFAIDLPITDYRIPTESVEIDVFYPEFSGWVSSKGEKYKDWYLHPAK